MLLFFVGAGAQITYTPQIAAGYQFKYLKADSGFALPVRDTTVGRGVNRPGLMVINPSDSLPYYYTGAKWNPVYVDSSGVIQLINGKVDSVTVNGNTLFYWIAGLGYGSPLNKLDSMHVSADSVFTCIAGTCTFRYLTTAGTGTITQIIAGFGLTGDTITATGTVAVDTSIFHTSAWNNATYAPVTHFHDASDIISGTLPIARGGTGLSGIGSEGQELRVKTGGTQLEYFTPAATTSDTTLIYTDSTIDWDTTSHPGFQTIKVHIQLFDSLLHKVIDTGSVIHDGYVLSYDSTNHKWVMVAPGTGGGSTDTSSLSARINLKLNISDTAAMLSPYLRSIYGLYQKITATANQSVFTFTLIPSDANKVAFLRNGHSLPHSAYSISGNTLTLVGGLQLNDTLEEQGVQ